MENKINIAELLEGCPKGMELYSPIFGKVYLDKVRPHLGIVVATDKYKEEFLYDGRYGMNGECMIFPSKDQRDWSKFVPPCKFKYEDIISKNRLSSIGYKWNEETKTLEKLEQTWTIKYAKDGDVLAFDDETIVIFKDLYNNTSFHSYCHIEDGIFTISKEDMPDWWRTKGFYPATEEQCTLLFRKIKEAGYHWNEETKTLEKLTPNKFDVSTLKPFESKVLMRSSNAMKWTAAFYSHKEGEYFAGCGLYCKQCVPYEGNEHLLNTTNDCDEYFKTWKE